MNDTEEAVRRLFAVAAEDVPPGIDLLRGMRARSRKRTVRVRAAVAAGAAAAVATGAAITLSAVQAPSALAQVTRAAARTAAASYRIRATEHIVKIGGLRSQPWATASGAFDPVKGVGVQRDNLGGLIRYAHGYTYVFVTESLRGGPPGAGIPIPPWASWERLPARLQPGVGVTPPRLAMLGGFPALLAQADPQDLLALLRSATHVQKVGPASGPGWTGTAYRFSAATTLTGPMHTRVSISGTVDVDRQGRVRRLDVLETFGRTVRKIEITFGGFGLPVAVAPPPARMTFIPPAG
jgi:hypothetical protein